MNPWISIWTKPRQTIRQIVDTNPKQHLFFLVLTAGAADLLMQVLGYLSKRGDLPLVLSAAIAMAFGAVAGLLGLYLIGFFSYFVAKRLSGQATLPQVRAAIAWSEVPVLWLFCLWLLLLVVSGGSLLTINAAEPIPDPVTRWVVYLFSIAFLLTVIWRIFLISQMMAEVNRFSIAKGILSILIPYIVILGPLALFNWQAIQAGSSAQAPAVPGSS